MVRCGLPHCHVPTPANNCHATFSQHHCPDCHWSAFPCSVDICHCCEHLAEESSQNVAQISQGLELPAIASSLFEAL